MGLRVIIINKPVIMKCSVGNENQVYVYIYSSCIKFGAVLRLDSNSRSENCFKIIFSSDLIRLILGSTQTMLFSFRALLAP